MTQRLNDEVRQTFLLALAKQNAGQIREAEPLYHVVLNRDPDYAEAHHNLGLILMNRGHHGAAVPYFRHAIRLQPKLIESYLSLAHALTKAGLAEDAETVLRQATGLNTGSAKPHFNLASLLHERGRIEQAEEHYRQAIRLQPNFRDAYNNFSNLLRQLDRRQEALEMLRRALAIDPDFALAHNNLGNIQRDLDQLEESVASYRRTVALAPDYALGHFNLGNALRDLGRMDEAAASFRKAIELDPSHADAYRHLVQVMRLSVDDPLVKSMVQRVEDASLGDADRAHYGFALGSVFDKHGDYDRAFAYFRLANSLKRRSFSYDPSTETALLNRIRDQFGALAARGRAPAANADETPIFIVGMMRSGTTLMEQILASHPAVTGGGELPFIQNLVDQRRAETKTAYPEFIANMTDSELVDAGIRYIRMVREKFGNKSRFITDKMPQNFLYIGLIHLMLPKARIIYMHRDPLDTCISIYTLFFTGHHPYAYDLREAGFYYQFSRDLMNFWGRVLNKTIYFQKYEGLIANPEESVRKLLAFCDLPFHAGCLEFHKTQRPVKTASAQQVRQRLHKGSVRRWENYDRHLSELKAMFAETEDLNVA